MEENKELRKQFIKTKDMVKDTFNELKLEQSLVGINSNYKTLQLPYISNIVDEEDIISENKYLTRKIKHLERTIENIQAEIWFIQMKSVLK